MLSLPLHNIQSYEINGTANGKFCGGTDWDCDTMELDAWRAAHITDELNPIYRDC